MTRRGFISMAAVASVLRADTPQERGRQIVDKVINALGGDGFRFMQTRTENGRAYSFYRDQISGLSIARIYTRYGPNGEMQRQVFGKKQDEVVLLNPAEGWDVTYRGAKPLPAERVKQFQETALHDVFYILLRRLKEPGIAFDSRGTDVVENQPVEILDIFDAENRNVTVWIHASTLLPVKQRYLRWDPLINDRREEVTRYSKYRESGNGVMWPWDTQRERDGEKIFELYSDHVTIGEDLKSDLFQLPVGAKVLKK